MAFFDFLGQGVGGTTPAQTAPGIAGEGDIVTSAAKPIGPTYGDFSRAALQYGSKPGSSGPALAGMMPQSAPQQNTLTPLSPNAPKQQKALAGQDTGDDSLAQIAKYLMLVFGGA